MSSPTANIIDAGDVLIIGAGLAGLFTALKLAPRQVTVLTGGKRSKSAASNWAQGGIAAVSGTPVAAMRFGKAIAEAGADLFFVQATVVSTDHTGPAGQETLDLEALCRDMGVPVVIGNCVTYDLSLIHI